MMFLFSFIAVIFSSSITAFSSDGEPVIEYGVFTITDIDSVNSIIPKEISPTIDNVILTIEENSESFDEYFEALNDSQHVNYYFYKRLFESYFQSNYGINNKSVATDLIEIFDGYFRLSKDTINIFQKSEFTEGYKLFNKSQKRIIFTFKDIIGSNENISSIALIRCCEVLLDVKRNRITVDNASILEEELIIRMGSPGILASNMKKYDGIKVAIIHYDEKHIGFLYPHFYGQDFVFTIWTSITR